MYIMALHNISNPELFWKKGQELLNQKLPPGVTLHHTFGSVDGMRAVCIWEAAAMEPVKNLLTPLFKGASTDTYMVTSNKEGVVAPPKYAQAPITV